MKIKYFLLAFTLFYSSVKISCSNFGNINSGNFFGTPDSTFDFEPTMDEGWDTSELQQGLLNPAIISQTTLNQTNSSSSNVASLNTIKPEPWDAGILHDENSQKITTHPKDTSASYNQSTTYDQAHFQNRSSKCLNVCNGQTEFQSGMNNLSNECIKCLCSCEDKNDINECPFNCTSYFSQTG